jgi:hypothetical protein
MTYSAAYFADEPATIRQQIGGLSWNWIMSRLLQVRVNRQVVSEAFELAILAPSLIAEAYGCSGIPICCHVRFQGLRTYIPTRFFFVPVYFADAGMRGGERALSDG